MISQFRNIVFLKGFILFFILFSFHTSYAKKKKKRPAVAAVQKDSVMRKVVPFDIVMEVSSDINDLIWFAKQQLGTPYKYASADPKNGGLDCSGFVYYVFGHYKIKVPRSSKDYMNFGKTIDARDAKTGDVIVFTGTDATQRVGGHVGIVLENRKNDITFIHGSSGKSHGVIISHLSDGYYQQRFLKIVRVIN